MNDLLLKAASKFEKLVLAQMGTESTELGAYQDVLAELAGVDVNTKNLNMNSPIVQGMLKVMGDSTGEIVGNINIGTNLNVSFQIGGRNPTRDKVSKYLNQTWAPLMFRALKKAVAQKVVGVPSETVVWSKWAVIS